VRISGAFYIHPLGNPRQEGERLARIWDSSIYEKEQETLAKYIGMLEDVHPWADVSFAKEYISRRTALRIWQHYLNKDPERECFYHDSENGDKVWIS
jgi:hypothetical protein